jgi:hypothetical protein
MNPAKLFCLTICLFSLGLLSKAQQVTPKFKELTLVIYQPNDSTKQLGITIYAYFHINSDGDLHFIFNEADGAYTGNSKNVVFTGVVRDTTYRLTDKVIAALNTIFNGERKLSSYRVSGKTPKGVLLSIPGNYVTYTDDNNVKDYLIFSELTPEANGILNYLFMARPARTESRTGVYHNKIIEAQIIKYHKACMCIPAADEPPTQKELQLK